jgi:hypothetical protein
MLAISLDLRLLASSSCQPSCANCHSTWSADTKVFLYFIMHVIYKYCEDTVQLLPPTLIPLSGVGTTCFYHVVIKIRQLFLRPAACLTSTLLETGC